MKITNVLSRVFNRIPRRWVNQSVNFKPYQFAFLERLSGEMGISVSRVTRRIIDQFIDGLEQDTAFETDRWIIDPEANVGTETWVTESVNLRRHQFRFLDLLAKEMGVSISGATRQIVAHFISTLEFEESPRSISVDYDPDPVNISPTPEGLAVWAHCHR